MKKIALILLFITTSIFALENQTMTVYKSPYCGCCTKWIDIMKEKGFNVKTVMVDNVMSVNQKLGIKEEHASCHTAVVNNYVIIGHVDYSAVKKMLTDHPSIKGLTVPGMPMGSPGMEQGHMKQQYNVLAINNNDTLTVYEKH